MDVKLSDDNMKDIIAKAVLDTLTPESRETMISEAIKALLLRPPMTNGYQSKTTPMQDAFNAAIRDVSFRIAQEKVADDPVITGEIEKLMVDAWRKLVEGDNRDKMVDKISGAMATALTGDRY